MVKPSIAKKRLVGIAILNYSKEQEKSKIYKDKSGIFLSLLNMRPMKDMAKRDKGSRMGRDYLKRNVPMLQILFTTMLILGNS